MSGNSDNKRIKISDFYKKRKITVSKKEQYSKNNSFKYFIGYNDNDIIGTLFVKRPQMTSYISEFKDKKK